MAGGIMGRLLYEDGCLYMAAGNAATPPFSLVWPPDIIPTVDELSGVVHVELPDGTITTVRLGAEAYIPGGVIVGPNAEERDVIGKKADGSQPEHCPTPYWLVSDVRSATPTPRSAP